MSVVESVVALVKPWADFYSDSKPAATIVTFLHIAGIMVGGGFAMFSDRAALKAVKGSDDDRHRILRDFAAVHRPVLTALTVVVISGAAMMLADAETFLVSPVYYTKIGLFALLLANGWVMRETEHKLAKDPMAGNKLWGRFTLGARASIALWLMTAFVGVALTNAA
jgi:hypothetical protein